MKHLELCYTPEEAELLQHMDRPGRFMSTREVADRAGKPLVEVETILADINKKNGIVEWPGFYSLPPMPIIFNIHQFYPEVKPDDLKAAELYQDYFF